MITRTTSSVGRRICALLALATIALGSACTTNTNDTPTTAGEAQAQEPTSPDEVENDDSAANSPGEIRPADEPTPSDSEAVAAQPSPAGAAQPTGTQHVVPARRMGQLGLAPWDVIALARLDAWHDATASLNHGAGVVSDAELRGHRAPPSARRVQLLFGSNNHGELEDCGCRSNPLGGLARRATIAGFDPVGDHPVSARFHLDAGNALFANNDLQTPADFDRSPEAIRAHAILRSFGAMNVGAMGVGERDLSLGVDFLRDAARQARVTLVNANLMRDGRTLFDATTELTLRGVRIGVVGASDGVPQNQDLYTQRGIEIVEPAEPVANAIAGLRAARNDVVVLIYTGGFDSARTLTTQLADLGRAPDLVIVSGSSRMMREPLFVGGVPVIEAANRGKHLVRLDMFLPAGGAGFRFRTTAPSQGRGTYGPLLTAIRALTNTERTMRMLEAGDPRRQQYTRLRDTQLERVDALARAARTGAPAPAESTDEDGSFAELVTDFIDVRLDIEEREDIRALVDAAKDQIAVVVRQAGQR